VKIGKVPRQGGKEEATVIRDHAFFESRVFEILPRASRTLVAVIHPTTHRLKCTIQGVRLFSRTWRPPSVSYYEVTDAKRGGPGGEHDIPRGLMHLLGEEPTERIVDKIRGKLGDEDAEMCMLIGRMAAWALCSSQDTKHSDLRRT
jgi:hypothetical protein